MSAPAPSPARILAGHSGTYTYSVGSGLGKGSQGRVKAGVCNETGQVNGRFPLPLSSPFPLWFVAHIIVTTVYIR